MAAPVRFSGPGDIIAMKYNAMLDRGGRKLWRGFLQLAAGGFGKGVLVTALVVTVTLALFSGWLSANSALTIGNQAFNTFESGLIGGISSALQFLTHVPGLLFLGAGGAVGAAHAMSKQNNLSLAQAKELAQQYEKARAMQPQQAVEPTPQVAPAPKKETGAAPDKKFAETELARRAQNQTPPDKQQGYGHV